MDFAIAHAYVWRQLGNRLKPAVSGRHESPIEWSQRAIEKTGLFLKPALACAEGRKCQPAGTGAVPENHQSSQLISGSFCMAGWLTGWQEKVDETREPCGSAMLPHADERLSELETPSASGGREGMRGGARSVIHLRLFLLD